MGLLNQFGNCQENGVKKPQEEGLPWQQVPPGSCRPGTCNIKEGPPAQRSPCRCAGISPGIGPQVIHLQWTHPSNAVIIILLMGKVNRLGSAKPRRLYYLKI